MKNFVIWTNCDVVSEDPEVQKKINLPRCDNAEARQGYDLMHRISRASAEKFLKGPWEAIIWDDPAPSRLEIFKRNWRRIRDLWHQEPCNILYLDSDTMFINPTEIFSRFNEFRLFNWSDPKTRTPFKNYYNAGVRYYPASMDTKVWAIGDAVAKHWVDDNWGMEQDVFNFMFWYQDVADPHHPELNWQAQNMIVGRPDQQEKLEQWNTIKVTDASLLHLHGSRGPKHTAMLMQKTALQIGIDIK